MADAQQADENLIDIVDDGVADATDDEVEGVLPFHYSITSYGADYPYFGVELSGVSLPIRPPVSA